MGLKPRSKPKSNKPPTNKVGHYFSTQAKVLMHEYKATSVVDRSVVGVDREVLLKGFLEKHLPGDAKIGLRGQVIDSNDSASWETDIIIHSPLGPRFGDLSFYLAENVLETIEVKSTLNKPHLLRALRNISKIKKLNRKYTGGEMALGGMSQKIPCGIFAYKTSLKASTIKQEIKNYYATNGDPVEKVDWVCVLDSFFIGNNEDGKKYLKRGKDGKSWEPASKGFLVVTRGYKSILHMLTNVSQETTRVISATPDFNKYIFP